MGIAIRNAQSDCCAAQRSPWAYKQWVDIDHHHMLGPIINARILLKHLISSETGGDFIIRISQDLDPSVQLSFPCVQPRCVVQDGTEYVTARYSVNKKKDRDLARGRSQRSPVLARSRAMDSARNCDGHGPSFPARGA
jgi:hypothetical protein